MVTMGKKTASSRRQRIGGRQQGSVVAQWVWGNVSYATRRYTGLVIALVGLVLSAAGFFRGPQGIGLFHGLALGLLGFYLCFRLFKRLSGDSCASQPVTGYQILELGFLLVSGTFALVEVTGGPSGLLYPLVYVLVAFLVAFHSLKEASLFLGILVVTEAAIWYFQPEPLGWRLLTSHVSFITLFGFLFAVFLRGEVVRQKSTVRRQIDNQLSIIADEAEDFRLTSALSLDSRDLSAEELSNRRTISSVQAIHDSLYNVLAVAERALQPYTVGLFWLDIAGQRLRLKELRSESDHVQERPIGIGEGVLGAIAKQKEPIMLQNMRVGHSGLVYYEKPEKVTDFIGVPVMERGHLRGILVADRIDGRSFDNGDLDVMTTIAEEAMRAVQVEQIFSQMDQEKFQKERFYQALRDFNSALTVDEVAQVTLRAARRVTGAEFAAVCVSGEVEGQMRIASCDWHEMPEYGDLVGEVFEAQHGLVGAAIKAKHTLPYGTARARSQRIFGNSISIPVAGVQVYPLLWKHVGVGALVIGSMRKEFLSMQAADMVRVIGDHAAIAIANAQMYERMEQLATTDGLTNLVNHRHYQELFDSMLQRAERYGRKFSLVLCDIDHFKLVNDNHGHPVGDMVLRKVARILESGARSTDVVARYGGEEFAILMEETDSEGANTICERIRKQLKAESFHSDVGQFNCTMSLGIATYPTDSDTKPRLTVCSDEALYEAKHNGRDQVVWWSHLKPKHKKAV
jgi:two-component system cell cycle response regulator